MAELLLELFSEEIPARMQARAADDLKRLVTDALSAASLEFSDARAFVTPRRLALVVDGLPDRQPDVTEERRGPRIDAPDKAIQGFLKGNGVTLAQCQKRDTGKGEFWFAVIERKGRATADVLGELLSRAIAELPWPKSMRWGDGEMRWVRSLQRILCVLDGAAVALSTRNAVPVGNTTSGHRFHAPREFAVKDFADYEKKLLKAHVMLDRAERKRVIAARAGELAAAQKLVLKDDPALLDEVAGLVEWPVPLIGVIDAAFMDLPAEVLETSMRTHQKYFSLADKNGGPAPRFCVVANIAADDGGKDIVAGNERVLRARLSDAKFFWDNDRRAPLESRVPALSDIIFHAKLGTLAEKMARVGALAAELAPLIPGADIDQVRSAATLAKADLTTEMVFEFPELQGIMGRYYALAEGEKPAVADAIAEHYSPLGPGDMCPTAPVSVAVALADKIDTLVGFFAIDEKPTGSRDPFALRRAALGIIRLVLENALRLKLTHVFGQSVALYDRGGEVDGAAVARQLLEFFGDRLKVHLREKGIRHDLISAVFAQGGEDDLVRLLARVDALKSFLATDDGANLLVAYRRAANIVAIEQKKDKITYDGDVSLGLLREDEEKKFYEYLGESEDGAREAIGLEGYVLAMAAMAKLRKPVDAFFDHVTVNCDDAELRANRLRLLARFGATLGGIADFSQIEG